MVGIALRFLVTVAAPPLCARLMEGVHAQSDLAAAVVGLILAVIYVLLRPLIRLVLTVFNFCTLGILNVVLDAFLLTWVAELTGGHLTFDSFWWALAASLAINALRLFIDVLTGKRKS